MSVFCVHLTLAAPVSGGASGPSNPFPYGESILVNANATWAVPVFVTSPLGNPQLITFFVNGANAAAAKAAAQVAAIAEYPAPWMIEIGAIGGYTAISQPATYGGSTPFVTKSVTQSAASVAAACTAAVLAYTPYLNVGTTLAAVAAEPRL